MILSVKFVCGIASVMAAINLIPLLATAGPGGDVLFHYALIDCFASQLWQGNLYPRWCMDTEIGLGAPPFVFYFPLSYYLTSIFYPLHSIGATVEHMYLLSLWLAGTVTVMTCWGWLKDIVSPQRALLASLLFLLMPYRMELLFYRAAFAEIWGVAFLPLLFLCARRLILKDTKYWVAFSCALAACLLTHVPIAIVGLIACGVYTLLLTGRHLKPKYYFCQAVFLAGLATVFYTAPAKYFTPDLFPESAGKILNTWANGYVLWEDITTRGHLPIIIGLAITVALTMGMAVTALKQQERIGQRDIRRETKAWIAIAALAIFLVFEISDPLWQALRAFLIPAFPWRAQALIMCAAVYLIAITMEWLTTLKHYKTWKADYAAAMALLALVGLFVLNTRSPDLVHVFDQAVRMHLLQSGVYRSRWTDADVHNFEHMESVANSLQPRAHIIAGKGMVEEKSWGWRGIVLDSDVTKEATIRLKHFYFPVWQLSIDGQAVNEKLTPEKHSGLMLVQAPPGKHTLELRADVGAAMGWRYGLAKIVSFIAAAILAVSAARCLAPDVRRRIFPRWR